MLAAGCVASAPALMQVLVQHTCAASSRHTAQPLLGVSVAAACMVGVCRLWRLFVHVPWVLKLLHLETGARFMEIMF